MNLCAGRAHGQEFLRLFVNLFTPDPAASILVTEHNLLHLPPHKPQAPTSPLIMFLKFYVLYTSKHAKKSTKLDQIHMQKLPIGSCKDRHETQVKRNLSAQASACNTSILED
jgi:hypothetical protein